MVKLSEEFSFFFSFNVPKGLHKLTATKRFYI